MNNLPDNITQRQLDDQIIPDGECACGGTMQPVYFWKNGVQGHMTDEDTCTDCGTIKKVEDNSQADVSFLEKML